MKKIILILAFCFLAGISSFTFAQTKREILTNSKIIELFRLGLSEKIIVEKIRQSECQCDTDTNALLNLKSAKIPDAIIMAILDSVSANNNSVQSKNSPTTPKNIPATTGETQYAKELNQMKEPGIYMFENGEMKFIEPSAFSGAKTNVFLGAITYGLKKTKIRAVVRGKSANLQTSNSQPEFFFVFNPEYRNSGAAMAGDFYGYAATSPAEFILVKMDQKEKSRETVVGEVGAFSGTSGAPDSYIRDFDFERIKTGIYKVTPKIALGNGEFCFYYAATASSGAGKIFDFSIVSKQ